jgi:hypothetical protein
MSISWFTLAALLLLTAVTLGVTQLLSWKHTRWRRYFALRDFADARGLRLSIAAQTLDCLPPMLAQLSPSPRPRWIFTGPTMSLLRLHVGVETFNLLLIKTTDQWPATALRPTNHPRSLFDQLPLHSYPSPYGSHRFTLHGVDPRPARRLSDSPCRALLPADLGLLIDGNMLVIDFSSRPFDTIELGRMISLGQQLVAFVPSLVEKVG